MIQSHSDDGFDDVLTLDPYAAIPEEMRRANSWLVYRAEKLPNGHTTKIPYHPISKHKSNDPAKGVSFDVAKAALGDFSGLGFFVESPFLAVDIDRCVNENGEVSEYAAEIIRELNTFSELSPSGTGIHVWGKGTKPGVECRRGSLELYTEKRFLTITGIKIPETPSEVRLVDVTPIFNRMVAGEFKEPEVKVESQAEPSPRIITEVKSGGKALTTKFELLMHGDIASRIPFVVQDDHENSVSYPSQSEADGALAALLAKKYDGDVEKMDADFRVSSLYREKWDRVDYRDRTLKGAVAFYHKNKSLEAPPKSPATVEAVVDEEEVLTEVETPLPDFPKFTGVLNDLCQAMSPDIPHAFKFVSAITHFGLIRSGLDTLAAEPHLQPRFYSALIAKPGRGKTAAINEVHKVMKVVSGSYKTFSSIDSGPALCDAFVEIQREAMMKADGADNLSDSVMSKILLSPDEIKGLFEKSKITTSSRNSMLDELLKLFENNTTGNRVRGAKIKIHIETAHLGLLGGATETGYAGMFTGTGGASDGLQSRIVPVGIEDRKMPSMQRSPNAEQLNFAIQNLIELVKEPGRRFELDDDAMSLYDKWWSAKDQTNPSETRIDGIVKRLLIVLARTNGVNTIGADLVTQGIEFGDFVIACRDKYNPLDSVTWIQSFENLIIAMYQKRGSLSANNCRRLVHPERRPGGAGPFLQAFKNLSATGILKPIASTQRSQVYRLSL